MKNIINLDVVENVSVPLNTPLKVIITAKVLSDYGKEVYLTHINSLGFYQYDCDEFFCKYIGKSQFREIL